MNLGLSPDPATVSGISDVSIGDVMHTGVVTCSPDDGLATLAGILVTHRIHAIVLAPLGRANPVLVTDRDIVRAALERPGSPRASEIARDAVPMLPSDAGVDVAVAMMAAGFFRHLLVTEPGSGAPVGVVSSFDVVAALGGQYARVRDTIQPLAAPPPRGPCTLAAVTVADVMTRELATCTADASLCTVARTMTEQRVHCVAIAGIERAGQHLIWGLIDDLDLVMAEHRGAIGEPAASIAATSPMAVEATDSLACAAELMIEHNTSHVVVAGPSGLPTGIVSTLDVARILAASD
jgi:CBS domain-containing protein